MLFPYPFFFLSKNKAGSEHIVFALVMGDVDYRALGLNYATDLRIQLPKKTGQMICTTQTLNKIKGQS